MICNGWPFARVIKQRIPSISPAQKKERAPSHKFGLFWIKSDWFIQGNIERPANWRFSKKIYDFGGKGFDFEAVPRPLITRPRKVKKLNICSGIKIK